ncbi:hypothetical protein KIW84_010973 [Lathyrus oleraceus]|uniref:Uncharacterized protein n=1 Tax=Pisum sativum TaxID=3888 RepID=A0A9D5BC13_PEA|nr:hypothetical protein KIW84_010973 [Pisum sativum]
MIQVVIPSHLVLKHKYTLIVGNTYIMQNFKVANNDFSFKATTHSFKLISYGATSSKVTKFPDIPLNHLKLISLTSIIAERFQPDFLVDVIGGVTKIIQTQMNAENNKNKVVFVVTDMSKSLVQYTLWGELASQFYNYYNSNKDVGKAGEDNPLEFPYPLEAIFKKELEIRVVFQPKYGRLFVVGFRDNKNHHTSNLHISKPSLQDELPCYSEPMSASADYDPAGEISRLTPSKHYLSDTAEDLKNVKLSSTKLMRYVKKEK